MILFLAYRSASKHFLTSITFIVCADVGEFVEADEVVARIETDKVTVDILSSHAGVITKYFAEEGDTVEVGGQFLEIDTDAKAPEGGAPAAAPAQEAPTPAPAVSRRDTLFSRAKATLYLCQFINYYSPVDCKTGFHSNTRSRAAQARRRTQTCPSCPCQRRPPAAPGRLHSPADC